MSVTVNFLTALFDVLKFISLRSLNVPVRFKKNGSTWLLNIHECRLSVLKYTTHGKIV